MTTITTAKLREIAHILGKSVDYTRQVLISEFDTEFDDTPADETEHDMGTMTITQEQFDKARLEKSRWKHGGPGECALDSLLTALGAA